MKLTWGSYEVETKDHHSGRGNRNRGLSSLCSEFPVSRWKHSAQFQLSAIDAKSTLDGRCVTSLFSSLVIYDDLMMITQKKNV